MERLIERWFPVRLLSEDSKSEREWPVKRYPIHALHVWFARRPHGVARATTLAALSPENLSRETFISFVRGRVQRSVRGWKTVPLFRRDPARKAINEFLERAYGQMPTVLDPMAGGGTIPFESVRLGARTIAIEINPLAYIILRATLEFPAKYGRSLYTDVKNYSRLLCSTLREKAGKYYPRHAGREVASYILAKEARCPTCKGRLLLAKYKLVGGQYGLRLSSRKKKVYLLTKDGLTFKISETLRSLEGREKTIVPHLPINNSCRHRLLDRRLIKQASMKGLCHSLMAVNLGGENFDLPTDTDIKAFDEASEDLNGLLKDPDFAKFIPDDPVTPSSVSNDIREFGISRWYQAFNPRQLLVNGLLARSVNEIGQELREKNDLEYALAVATYLAFMVDKVVDYNSILTQWRDTYVKIGHTLFDPAGGFRFTYDYGELNMAYKRGSLEWARNDVLKTLSWVTETIQGLGDKVKVLLGDSLNLSRLTKDIGVDKVHLVNVDPPYYDNIMYAELSEFFWVWLKRMIGDLLAEEWSQRILKTGITSDPVDALSRAKSELARFEPRLTRSSEVVANKALAVGRAKERFEQLMRRFLGEVNKVLRDDGLLVIWFTHSKLESWEALIKALDEAGFVVGEAWSVWTEIRERTAARNKSALMSTVLLACRKRIGEAVIPTPRGMLRNRIVETLLTRLPELEQYDITGPDLFIASIGIALKGSMEHKRAEEALGVAYEAVGDALVRYLFGERAGALDPSTRGYVALMYVTKGIKGRKLTFDEINKIAKGLRASMPDLESYDVVLREDRKKGGVYAVGSSRLARDRKGNIKLSLEDPRLAERIKSRIVRAKASLVDVSRFILMKVSLEGQSALATLGQLMKYGYTINTFRDAVKLLRIMDKCADKGELEYRGKFIIGLVEDAIKKIGA